MTSPRKTGSDSDYILINFVLFPFISALLVNVMEITQHMPWPFIGIWLSLGLAYRWIKKKDNEE
jgi:hypothetical protein